MSVQYPIPKVEVNPTIAMGQQKESDAFERLLARLTPEECEEADRNLKEYAALAWRVCEYLEYHPEAYEAMLPEIEKRNKQNPIG